MNDERDFYLEMAKKAIRSALNKTMSKEQLIEILLEFNHYEDKEEAHEEADQALLNYIDDDEVRKAFNGLDKWYS